MNLLELAESDLALTLEGDASVAVKVTDPNGITADIQAGATDIGSVIDPETGAMISGREASVEIRISTLVSKGLGVPEGISDNDSKSWLIDFNDVNGNLHKFRVKSTMPDLAAGIVVCRLDIYNG